MGVALIMSDNWRAAMKRWDLILWAMGLQFIFAFLILKTGAGKALFEHFNDAFVLVIDCTKQGTEFIFGPLMAGGPMPDFALTSYADAAAAAAVDPTAAKPSSGFFIILTNVLPTIIFFSALTSVAYHYGIMQFIVRWIAWVMQRTLRTSGAETFCASANIFVGQTEAPLVVKPFLGKMTKSELMTVMVGGFAGIAGGVLAAYVGMLVDKVPNIAGHLMASSVMTAPAGILFAKLIVPEEETPETIDTLHVQTERTTANGLDAVSVGTTEGITLAINVGGMLIAFIALVAFVDLCLGGIGGIFSAEPIAWLNLKTIVGYIFTPMAYCIGIVDPKEANIVGQLLGTKIVTNEFVAYLDLASPAVSEQLSERSRMIAAYALCGFSNLASIGIQIGGLSVMAPNRRADLSRLAFRAMIAGMFATSASACVAAILL